MRCHFINEFKRRNEAGWQRSKDLSINSEQPRGNTFERAYEPGANGTADREARKMPRSQQGRFGLYQCENRAFDRKFDKGLNRGLGRDLLVTFVVDLPVGWSRSLVLPDKPQSPPRFGLSLQISVLAEQFDDLVMIRDPMIEIYQEVAGQRIGRGAFNAVRFAYRNYRTIPISVTV